MLPEVLEEPDTVPSRASGGRRWWRQRVSRRWVLLASSGHSQVVTVNSPLCSRKIVPISMKSDRRRC